MPQFKRTRLAPTPSGYLHLGNLLSFAITAKLAHENGAKILLRIDDLDRDRVQAAYVQDIFDTLSFLGIPYDEGPRNMAGYDEEWSQLHRMENYLQALDVLKEKGLLFACDCSRAQIKAATGGDRYPGTCLHKNIPLDAPNVCWRLKTYSRNIIKVITVAGPITATLPDEMKYFIIRKKDGFPAYQLTSVVDDVWFGVDLIVRGADLWNSTLAQLYLAPLMGAEEFCNCTFYHHPLLMTSGNKKLSKSAGATSVHYLRRQGSSKQQVLTEAAKQAGFGTEVKDWEQLADLVRPL